MSSRAVVPEALRRTLSEAIGAPNMTKGVHVAAVELYAAEDGVSLLGLAVYSRRRARMDGQSLRSRPN